MPPLKAKKFDQNKPDLSLLPFEALQETAKVLMFGVKKYGQFNWRAGSGLAYSRLISAALRHIHQFNDGEDFDDETKTLHLANAICNLMFLITYHAEERKELDDRYVKPSNRRTGNGTNRSKSTKRKNCRGSM